MVTLFSMKRSITAISILLFLVLVCCSTDPKIEQITADAGPPLAQKLQSASTSACPSDMVEIDGNYCPRTDELCLYWVTIDGKKTNIMTDRCGEFRQPVHCLVTPVHKHFCIDKFEFPNKEGSIPKDWMTFYDVRNFCAADNKRMCTHSEWTTSASGDEYHPYPFGNGFIRDHSCNIDQHIHGVKIMKVADPNESGAVALRNKLVPSGSMPNCISTWGVMDLAGNIDEFVVNESGKPYKSSMVGGHWAGVRNRSRPSTDAHNEYFKWWESGGRCCQDTK